jgi:hypothetical protein
VHFECRAVLNSAPDAVVAQVTFLDAIFQRPEIAMRALHRLVDRGAGEAESEPVRELQSSLAGIVLKLPRVSYPAKASAATRDAKCLGAGRERPQGLSRPFSSRRMWSVSLDFDGGLGGEAAETALFLPVMRQVFAQLGR